MAIRTLLVALTTLFLVAMPVMAGNWEDVVLTYKSGDYQKAILIDGGAECNGFAGEEAKAKCKLGYYLGRSHAALGILGAVVPNCWKVLEQQLFFSSYAEYVFEYAAPALGLARGIDNSRIEKRLGKEAADINNRSLSGISELAFQQMKSEFGNAREKQLAVACQNFRSQIERGELTIEEHLDRYLEEFKKAYPREYEDSRAITSLLSKAINKLRNSRPL